MTDKVSDEQVCRTLAQGGVDLDTLRAYQQEAYDKGQTGLNLTTGDLIRFECTIRDLVHIVRFYRDKAIIENHYGFKIGETHTDG